GAGARQQPPRRADRPGVRAARDRAGRRPVVLRLGPGAPRRQQGGDVRAGRRPAHPAGPGSGPARRLAATAPAAGAGPRPPPRPRRSLWRVEPSPTLRRTHPELDYQRVIFLTDPDLDLAVTVLTGEALFDRDTARAVRGVAVGLLAAGGLCLLLYLVGRRGRKRPGPQEHVAPPGDYERERLVVEVPVSEHHFLPGAVLQLGLRRVSGGVLALLVGVLVLGGAATALARGQTGAAGGIGLVGLFFGAAGLALVSATLRMYSGGVSAIAVCHSGLRWQAGDGAH